MKESIEDALGDSLELVKERLATRYEGLLRGVEIKAGCRYPTNGAARVAFGVIRMKARAAIRASEADIAAFNEAIGKNKPAPKKVVAKKSKSE